MAKVTHLTDSFTKSRIISSCDISLLVKKKGFPANGKFFCDEVQQLMAHTHLTG